MKSYNSVYFVSENGDVFSCKKQRFLKKSIHSKGYEVVDLFINGKRKTAFVHRLVAECFIGVSDMQVNHIDGNKLNNNVKNLEYVSNRENRLHSLKDRKKPIGVFKHGKKYRAISEVGDKKIYLGSYETQEEARKAYVKFCLDMGDKKYLQKEILK